jgi:hypothetical protein
LDELEDDTPCRNFQPEGPGYPRYRDNDVFDFAKKALDDPELSI